MLGTAVGLVVMCLTLTTSIMCKITILLQGLRAPFAIREYAGLNNFTTSQFGVIQEIVIQEIDHLRNQTLIYAFFVVL